MTTAPPESSPTEALEDRVAALEAHVTHLEAANADLSDMIARQWDEIDRMRRTMMMLHDQMGDALPAPDVRPPPHY